MILFASYAATKFRSKSIILLLLVLPVIAGLAMLYTISHTDSHQGALLAGYYLLAFLYGGNPLIVAWIVGNTAGTTKKTAVMSVYQLGTSAGNIIGYLYKSTLQERTLLTFVQTATLQLKRCTSIPSRFAGRSRHLLCSGRLRRSASSELDVLEQATGNCFVRAAYNQVSDKPLQERKRVEVGKPAKIKDLSMQATYQNNSDEQLEEPVDSEGQQHARIGDQAFMDLTDRHVSPKTPSHLNIS